MVRLSRSDLEAVLDFASEAAVAARDREPQDRPLLERIARLIDSDTIKYGRLDASDQEHDVTVLGHPAEPEPTSDVLEVLRSAVNPYRAFAARTGQPHYLATRLFDLVDRVSFRRSELYQVLPYPEASSVQMAMPGIDRSVWKLEVLQPDREFTDRQLALLDAVRPWLGLYQDRRVAARRVATVRVAPTDQVDAARLSDRERQVLDRVADGASNQDIATALHISPGTVRKHLENIYAKLEVTSRTAALARTGRTIHVDGRGSRAGDPSIGPVDRLQ